MRTIPQNIPLVQACKMIQFAAKKGIWDGKTITQYFDSCKWLFPQYPATVIYTKEEGYHTGGWWRNPEYERCWHLSMSFKSGSEKKVKQIMIDHFFHPYQNYLWAEPPYSKEGIQMDVWHYRLFCDLNWSPIKPRGEVYDSNFTEVGWKSFSELNKIQ